MFLTDLFYYFVLSVFLSGQCGFTKFLFLILFVLSHQVWSLFQLCIICMADTVGKYLYLYTLFLIKTVNHVK